MNRLGVLKTVQSRTAMEELKWVESLGPEGLRWEPTTFGLEPRWATEPQIGALERLARRHLRLDAGTPCDIRLFGEGAFNKVYKVATDGYDFVLRIPLRVDPLLKTWSEVATFRFCRQVAIPVPRILAFDMSHRNELGHEWMLMDMMPGQHLSARWRKLPMAAKEDVVKRLAGYQARLFSHQFQGIGNLYSRPDASSDFDVGRIVSIPFFWADNLYQPGLRGPFKTSFEWLLARLCHALRDQEHVLATSEDEDDLEDAQAAKDIVIRLLRILPKLFPPGTAPEPTCLFHDDLSMKNVLCDEAGKITAVLDWEFVSTLPLWRACQLPALLEGCDRETEPQRDDYAPDSTSPDAEPTIDAPGQETLDNEGVDELFWDHLMEYELTQLRQVFLEEIQRIEPNWVTEMERSVTKREFEAAVQNCQDGFSSRSIEKWLDRFESSNQSNSRVDGSR